MDSCPDLEIKASNDGRRGETVVSIAGCARSLFQDSKGEVKKQNRRKVDNIYLLHVVVPLHFSGLTRRTLSFFFFLWGANSVQEQLALLECWASVARADANVPAMLVLCTNASDASTCDASTVMPVMLITDAGDANSAGVASSSEAVCLIC